MSKKLVLNVLSLFFLFVSAGPFCPCVAAGHDEDQAPFVDVRQFGAKGDGAADDTAAIQAAADTIESGTVYFPPGIYLGRLSIRKNGISIRGSGSSRTVLRMPPGVDGNVLELGYTAAGADAPAFERISVTGMTLDGNRADTPAPVSELTGWGMPVTKVSHASFSDIRAINCWNGGVGFFCGSNCNMGEFHVAGCGNPALGTPGFDMKGSKCCVFDVESRDCLYGARVAEDCVGNQLTMDIVNPGLTGLLCGSRAVARGCANNRVRVTVNGGAADQAVLIGARWYGNILDITAKGYKGKAVSVDEPGPDRVVGTDGEAYTCTKDHTSSEETKPVMGADWRTFWSRSGRSGRAGRAGGMWRPDAAYMAESKAWGNLVNESPRMEQWAGGL